MTTDLTTPTDSPLDTQVRKAKLLCDSQFVPAHFRGKPADLLVAIQLAERIKVDPMAVLSGTFVISGKVGMTTAFMISLERKANIFDAPIRYEQTGEPSLPTCCGCALPLGSYGSHARRSSLACIQPTNSRT